jgi:Methyltransferase domain
MAKTRSCCLTTRRSLPRRSIGAERVSTRTLRWRSVQARTWIVIRWRFRGPELVAAGACRNSRWYRGTVTASRGPSGHYLRLLDRIHTEVLPRTYVEIGVANGKSLAICLPGTLAIGVDPEPHLLYPIDRSAKVFPLTSDDFFAGQDLSRELRGFPIDLAFIDGRHLFEYALRDFINVERWSSPESVVLIHDCYPHDSASAQREPDPSTRQWAGDVWKLIVCLKDCRPDLHVATVDVPPTGLGVITNLDPTATQLSAHYDEVCRRYIDMPLTAIERSKPDALNRVPDDWYAVKALLPDSPFRPDKARHLRFQRSQRLPNLGGLPREAQRRIGLSALGPSLRRARAALLGP